MRRTLAAALVVVLAAWSAPAQAKKVIIKLGTMAPDGSSWHLLLKEMAQQWHEVSDGTVKLKIYPGGVAGNEGDMVRKMRIGQLHAAALTIAGLGHITPAPQAISVPGIIQDEGEWAHVFAEMQPRWDKLVADKGFEVLLWGDVGWIYMFVTREVKTPADLEGMKAFVWAGDPSVVDAWRLARFQPIILSATDMLQGLTTGMVEIYATTPIIAMTTRWYEQTPYMIKTPWGHLPGVTLVAKKRWEKIPADTRAKLVEVAAEYTRKVNAEVARMQADAIEVMTKNGLKIVEFDEAGKKAWLDLAERAFPAIRGGMVSEAEFDEVIEVRDAYRESLKKDEHTK